MREEQDGTRNAAGMNDRLESRPNQESSDRAFAASRELRVRENGRQIAKLDRKSPDGSRALRCPSDPGEGASAASRELRIREHRRQIAKDVLPSNHSKPISS